MSTSIPVEQMKEQSVQNCVSMTWAVGISEAWPIKRKKEVDRVALALFPDTVFVPKLICLYLLLWCSMKYPYLFIINLP